MQAMIAALPEIAEVVCARMMARSGAKHFRMNAEMCEGVRRMIVASLPSG